MHRFSFLKALQGKLVHSPKHSQRIIGTPLPLQSVANPLSLLFIFKIYFILHSIFLSFSSFSYFFCSARSYQLSFISINPDICIYSSELFNNNE